MMISNITYFQSHKKLCFAIYNGVETEIYNMEYITVMDAS